MTFRTGDSLSQLKNRARESRDGAHVGSPSTQAQRMAASTMALDGYALAGIEAGAVKTIIDAAIALGAQADRVVQWCATHPMQPLPREHKTRLSEASRLVLEARADLMPRS